jgi:hypothetical protein
LGGGLEAFRAQQIIQIVLHQFCQALSEEFLDYTHSSRFCYSHTASIHKTYIKINRAKYVGVIIAHGAEIVQQKFSLPGQAACLPLIS